MALSADGGLAYSTSRLAHHRLLRGRWIDY